MQADTIVPQPGNPQALNRYAYVLNSPLRYRDPTGHAVCVDAECTWIVHPVSGEIRQRRPTNSPPEQPGAYDPAESYQQAMGLVNEFRSNVGPFEREFGPTSSLTQDIMYSSGIQEFHQVWAEAGYPDILKWHHHVDVWEGGSYPLRFVKSTPGYIGAQVKLALAGVGLRSKTPEGSIDAVNGTIGSLDTIQVKRVGSGWIKVEVHNRMDWQHSGLRIPGGDASLWNALDALKVPGADSTLGDVWIGVVGGGHPTEQTFYWWEPVPGSR